MTDPRPPFQGDSSRGRLPRAEVLGCFPFVLRALGIHTRKCPNCRAKGSNSFAAEPGGYSFAHKGTSLTERSRSVSLTLLNVICPSGTRSRRGVLKTLTVLRCGTSDLAISPLIPRGHWRSAKVRGREKHRPVRIRRVDMAPLIAGTMIDQRRYYAAIGALRRPRAGLIPRLPPARLLSGLTSFWPDCRRDFSSAFARRFEFLFAIQRLI